jgi:hypothetical protein
MFPQTPFENEIARELQHDRLAALGRPQLAEWLREERTAQPLRKLVRPSKHHTRRPL